MVFVTGATGQLGSLVIKHLLEKNVDADKIAALTRTTSDTSKLKEWKINCRVADYNDRELLSEALQNTDTLVFIAGNDFRNRMRQHCNVIEMACLAGVRHIIYTSSVQGGNILLPIIRDHIETENLISGSGIDFTILRINLYMENIAGYIGKEYKKHGIFYPAGNGKMSFISRKDIAETIANIVLKPQAHKGQKYEISNTQSYSFYDIADVISNLTGIEIHYHNPSVDEYRQRMEGKIPEVALNSAILFGKAMAAGEFQSSKTDIEKLLGHSPIGLGEYLADFLDKI